MERTYENIKWREKMFKVSVCTFLFVVYFVVMIVILKFISSI
jgi:hypothetical protein